MELQALLLICGFCGKVIRDGKLPVSHGICRLCADRVLAQMVKDEKDGLCKPPMH